MIYVKWFFLAFGNLVLKYLVAFPLTPIIVLFAQDDGHLPSWLYYFDTPDNTIDGDNGWKNETRPIKNENNRFKRYINRVFWLWRNSLYGFNRSILAVQYRPGDYITWKGDRYVTNAPNGCEGWVFKKLWHDFDVIAWQYYYIKKVSEKKCLRILLGYKLFQFKYGYGVVTIALSIGLNKFRV